MARFRYIDLPHVQLTITDLFTTVTAQPMTSLALEQKSTLAFGASNVFSRNKRHASANLSSDLPRSPDVLGLENVESGTKLALRQNKRRRVIT